MGEAKGPGTRWDSGLAVPLSFHPTSCPTSEASEGSLRRKPGLAPQAPMREGDKPTFDDQEPRGARGLAVDIHCSAAVQVRVLARQLVDLRRGPGQGNRASAAPFLAL